MRTIVIGRSPFADAVIADTSVAPYHAEIVVTEDHGLHLTDCGSEMGTWRRAGLTGDEAPQWQRVRQAFIRPDDVLRLGNYISTAEALLKSVLRGDETDSDGQTPGAGHAGIARRILRGAVQRDPATGEIVRRRP